MIEPLRLSFVVACPVEHAFAIWTARTSAWWPADHTATGRGDLEIVLEPRIDGRIFERTPAGEEVDWGWVTHWEPPHRLGYRWHLRQDRRDASDVAIAFTPLPDAGTRVDIEHRGWERLGAAGQDRRDANRRGWDGLLGHYMAACAGVPPSTGRFTTEETT